MANLILTQSCNKNCSYCFARQFRFDTSIAENEMSLDTVNAILDKLQADKNPNVSLLGGEPTQHSQFGEILKLCLSRKFNVSLISNFLFSSEIRGVILKALETNQDNINFLINTTELRVGDRMDIFKTNYNAIYDKVKDKGKITCGFTFDGELMSKEGFKDYLTFVSENLTAINNIRLSLNFPGDEKDKGVFPFINNLELGDLLYFAARCSLYFGASPSIDCISFPCMYRNDLIRGFINQYDKRKNASICQGAPTDYLPDQTARYCFPTLKNSVDITRFKTDSGIRTTLFNRYTAARKRLGPPEVCKGCEFLKASTCQGPCLGFRKDPVY